MHPATISAPPEAGGKRLKVLICAYACNPTMGSEPGVGWGWVKAIARYHDLWVLTNSANQRNIEDEIARTPDAYHGVHFHYIPRKRWRGLERIWPPAYLWTYHLWLREAYAVGRRLHQEIGFDLVHQLTYVTFRAPGHLWKLDVPFVWGPIGGLENTPWRLLPAMGLKGAVHFACRNVINSFHKRFLRAPKRAFRKAASRGAVIAATEGVRKEIRRWYGCESRVICEVAAPEPIAGTHSVRLPGEPLRLAWSGLHIPRKALPLLLRALARLPGEVDWCLDVLGHGPCTGRWQRLTRRLGLDGRCTWRGWLPREEAIAVMRKAHVFVITSLQDLTSTVLMEALALGLPVVCPDHCGFSDVVTAECGIAVPAKTPKQIMIGFGTAIERVWANEERRRALAEGARWRAAASGGDEKARAVNCVYGGACQRYYRTIYKGVIHAHRGAEPRN